MRRSLRPLALLAPILLLACSSSHTGSPDGGDSLEQPLGPPSVSSIAPSSGPKSGGTVVSVLGTNFGPGARLFLGAAEATHVSVISDRRLVGRSSASQVNGPVDVTVVSADGGSAVLKGGFSYIPPPDERTAVDGCQIEAPLSISVGVGSTTTSVIGAVTAIGVTDSPGQGPNIAGQLGFGPADQPVDSAYWTWITASYDDGSSGSKYDGYVAQIVAPALGDFRYAYRFQYRGGDWTYCDLDGSEDGFNMAQAGDMLVHPPTVTWCDVEAPQVIATTPGNPATLPDGGTTLEHSQVYQPNVTTAEGNEGELAVQFGYGPNYQGPGSWPSANWIDATYNGAHKGAFSNNYEYVGQIIGPKVGGTYSFAFRYALNGGPWTYCGSANPVDSSATAGLAEMDATGLNIDSNVLTWCDIDSPTSMSVTAGQFTPTVTSEAYLNGLTTQSGNDGFLKGELGIGPSGTGPVDPSWVWSPANFSNAGGGQFGNNYVYTASTAVPADAGSYAYAFRYSILNGPYTYCGLTNPSDGGTADLGSLTVNPGSGGGGGGGLCAFDSLSAAAVGSGQPVTTSAKVTVAGVTDSAGQAPGFWVQAGVGPSGSSPTDPGWAWKDASYTADDGGSDVYSATLRPSFTGDRLLAMRVSQDDGGTWTTCDSSAVGGGALTVNPGGTSTIAWCNLQWPPNADGGTGTYGQVYASGITDKAADAGSITAQLGYGPSNLDPSVSATWSWLAAGFNTASGNNYEYTVALPAIDAGISDAGVGYAYRFSTDGLSWCYGDTSGAAVGFSSSTLGAYVP